MTGQAVAPQGAVEVRWNSDEGPVLGETNADALGNFAVTVRVPDAKPGVYTIIAVARGSGVARSVFEVTSGTDPPAKARAGEAVLTDSPWRTLPSESTDVLEPGNSAPGPMLAGLALLGLGAAGIAAFATILLRRRSRASLPH